MKAILKYPLYRRITPSNRQEALGYLPAGSVVEIAERMVGDKIDGIDSWIKGVDGFHYWEGGVERTPPQLDSAKLLSSFIEEYRLEEFWKRGYDGRNVKVGIIDSHFDKEHPALKNLRYLSCVNLGETNQKHHGSYMASIIGGADYDSGIVGVAPGADFKLVGIGSEGKISVSRFEDALKALGDVDVISMSMTNSSDSFASIETKARFKALLSEKFSLKLFLAAAGNEGDWQGYAKRLYPANFDEVFAVAGFSIATPQVIVNSNFSLSKKNKHFVHHYSGFFDKIQPAVF
ncbi:MAG: S8 family serine peptidase, partial [Chitinophagaceae bacterium]|nr:S8 family serine peptidase [Chitinophagaceae bacterium]